MTLWFGVLNYTKDTYFILILILVWVQQKFLEGNLTIVKQINI